MPAGATAIVHVPYQVAAIGTSSQGRNSSCPSGTGAYIRWAVLQLQDQLGNPIKVPGIQMHDTIKVGSRNDLGLGTPATGTMGTDANGGWTDEYFYSCTSACANYSSVPETDALQYWTYNGLALPQVNALVYKCVSITTDGK
jgi:hypothetical protein